MVTDINSIREKKLIQAEKSKDWGSMIHLLGLDQLDLTPKEEAEAWAMIMQIYDDEYGHLPTGEPMPEFTKRRVLEYWESVRKKAVFLDYSDLNDMLAGVEIWERLEPLIKKTYPGYKLMELRWIIRDQAKQAEESNRYDEAKAFWEIAHLILEIDPLLVGK